MTQPVFPIYPVPPVPMPEMVLRSRHELSTRDAANARNYEHWQTDGKYGIYNRPDMNAQAPFHESLPINSRMVERRYHPQPRFVEDNWSERTSTGPRPLGRDAGHRGGMNPYFDKYDTAYDSRNMIRELQSVVYEDKGFEYLPQSRAIVTRGVEHRWLDGKQIQATVDEMESDTWAKGTNRMICEGLESAGRSEVWPAEARRLALAGTALRPIRDDIQRTYR